MIYVVYNTETGYSDELMRFTSEHEARNWIAEYERRGWCSTYAIRVEN